MPIHQVMAPEPRRHHRTGSPGSHEGKDPRQQLPVASGVVLVDRNPDRRSKSSRGCRGCRASGTLSSIVDLLHRRRRLDRDPFPCRSFKRIVAELEEAMPEVKCVNTAGFESLRAHHPHTWR